MDLIDKHATRLGLNVSAQGAKRSSSASSSSSSITPFGGWRRKCRRFAVGSRKDYRSSIKQALLDLQLCETSTKHWDVFWGDQWLETSQFTSNRIKPGALVNSIPGFRSSFGDKVAFAALHERCLEQRKAQQQEEKEDGEAEEQHSAPLLSCSWTKRGFSFERRAESITGPVSTFRSHAAEMAARVGGDRNEYPQLWILKPQQSYNQMGISMVYLEEGDLIDDDAAAGWLRRVLPLDGSWTLQEYVKHPLLYRGRKFDLRVWAVITSIDPLRIYLLERAFPKISTVDYTADAAAVGRHCLSSARCACMHVRMPMGEGCDKASLVSPYPPHTASPTFQRGLRFGPTFKGRTADPRDDATIWERVVMPQIAEIVTTAVVLARDAGALAQHRLVESRTGGGGGGGSYRRVLLLSPDFIVDEDGVAYCEEVNTNGFLVGDDELYHAQADELDLMRLVGADGWPKRPLYAEHVSDLVKAFVAEKGFDEHDAALLKPALKSLMHEDVAARPTAWRRIFPAPSSQGSSMSASSSSPSLLRRGPNGGFATDLDEATAEFLAYIEASPATRRLLSLDRINASASELLSGTSDLHSY